MTLTLLIIALGLLVAPFVTDRIAGRRPLGHRCAIRFELRVFHISTAIVRLLAIGFVSKRIQRRVALGVKAFSI